MDDKLFDPKKDDFFQKIGEAEKFGIIEEEKKRDKKIKKRTKGKNGFFPRGNLASH